ncbi:hypothetical protein NQD34_000449, partial [Periophthalmus magnuspinnatus]
RMNYEERVAFLGNWGPFQRRLFIVLCLCSIPPGFTILSVIFLLATPPHQCYIPSNSNLSHEWIQAIIPAQEHMFLQEEQRSCSRYALDIVMNASLNGLRPGQGNATESEVMLQTLPLEECGDGWSFSQQYFTSTVVTEFNLVCGDQWKQPLSSLIFFLGGLCGCFVCGQLSDRVGRKPVLFSSLLLLGVFGGGLALAPSWPVFMALFFMLGLEQGTIYVVIFVLGSEVLTGKTRVVFSGLALPVFFAFGSMLLPCTAYVLTSWRHLTWAIAASSIACLPFGWVVPESPRWLLSLGHKEDAERILQMAALETQVEAPASIFPPEEVLLTAFSMESCTFLDLLKTRNIRHITVILWISWLSIYVSNYGLSFSATGLRESPFLTYILVSAIELPSYLFSLLAAAYCRRRMAFIIFGAVAIVGVLPIFLTTDICPTVTLCLVLVCKFGVLVVISCMYIHTGELFPTIIRNTAMSSCAMFGRLGACLSPYLQHLAVVAPSLPWLVLALLPLLTVLLLSFLPETFQEPLPDAIEQM